MQIPLPVTCPAFARIGGEGATVSHEPLAFRTLEATGLAATDTRICAALTLWKRQDVLRGSTYGALQVTQ